MKAPEQLHFIGIGGIGMSGLAQVALALGSQVSGSDRADSARVARLQALGATVTVGHHADSVPAGTPTVVVSTAIKADNPELVAAKARQLPIWHRSQLLGHFMRQTRSVAVTGTHGKTTTSAMAALVLTEAGLQPTSFIGGDVPALSSNAVLGDGAVLVAEVDESDRSLQHLGASMAIVTNLEADHLDHYKDLDEIIDTVAAFVRQVPADGTIILGGDCPGNLTLRARLQRPVITYGFGPAVDVRAEMLELGPTSSRFAVWDGDEALGEFLLSTPGEHNVSNALAVVAMARHLHLDLAAVRRGLAGFRNVARRFQHIGEMAGMTVIDDYAHHPSEVRAVLATARLTGRGITAVFQPHRYSRLNAFLDDFAAALAEADRVVITETYSAGEKQADFPATAADLAAAVGRIVPGREVKFYASLDEVADYLRATPRDGEIVLTLGAGDVTTLGPRLVAAPAELAG